METREKVVARFLDGRLVKGYLTNFSVDADTLVVQEQRTREDVSIAVKELKAVFFVKSFEGYCNHVKGVSSGIRKLAGRKAAVKFRDRETLVGFVEGTTPWDKRSKAKGFYLTPVDVNSNNEKIFIVGSAIEDLTIMVV